MISAPPDTHDPLRLESLLAPVDRLPVLSPAVIRLLQAQKLAPVVRDQILQAAAGPPLAGPEAREIADVQRAVLLYRVRRLAHGSETWAPAMLWHRAIRLAEACRLRARAAGEDEGLSWRCGLLRETGLLLSEYLFPEVFAKNLAISGRLEDDFQDRLSDHLGLEIPWLGTAWLKRWGLNCEAREIEASWMPGAEEGEGRCGAIAGLLARVDAERRKTGGKLPPDCHEEVDAGLSRWETDMGRRLDREPDFAEACAQQERRILGICEEGLSPVAYGGWVSRVMQELVEELDGQYASRTWQLTVQRAPGSGGGIWTWSWARGSSGPFRLAIRRGGAPGAAGGSLWPATPELEDIGVRIRSRPGPGAVPEMNQVIRRHAPALAAALAAAEQEAARVLSAGHFRAAQRRAESVHRARLQEVMEQVSSAAAHDLNNPLQVISGRAQMLMRQLAADSPTRQMAGRIEEQVRRLGRLIRDWHHSSRKPQVSRRGFEVAGLLEDAKHRAARRLGRPVVCRIGALPEPAIWHSDPQALAEALAEALVNAAEAGGGQAEVEMGASVDRLKRRCILWVADRSGGMDGETARLAFEPFISRKPAGRRSGLGLARVRSRMAALGGEASLISRPGAGTRLILHLPWEESPIHVHEPVNPSAASGSSADRNP